MPTHLEWLVDELSATLTAGHYLPARHLDIVDDSLGITHLAARVAEACFGDASLVYDVTARLTSPEMHDVESALSGVPPGHASLAGESLVQFIESRGRGVIAIEDLQEFAPHAIETLARIAESGWASKDGTSSSAVPARRFVFLAFGRLSLPSPRELMQRTGDERPWAPENRPPYLFRDALERIASERYPRHFSPWVVGRFEGVDAGFAWERYCDRVARHDFNTPLVAAPLALAVPARPPQPMTRDLVADVAAIPTLPQAGDPYDVFISYSWSRTEDNASWLREKLKERGLRVFFDKDELTLAGLADDQIKTVLIQRLSAIVRRSRSWVVFAAALRQYSGDGTLTDAEAVARSVAMEVKGALVEWSWQTLEMRHMGQRLVIGDSAAYMVGSNGDWDPSFGKRRVEDREDMLRHVLAYLDDMGVQASSV